MELNKGWRLLYFDKGGFDDKELSSPDYNDTKWHEAAVPGDVHATTRK